MLSIPKCFASSLLRSSSFGSRNFLSAARSTSSSSINSSKQLMHTIANPTSTFARPPSRFENIHRVKPSKDSCPLKGMWISGVVGGALTASPDAVGMFLLTSGITLCGGHSLGMHRRLIHNSFECPLWVERILVWLGTLVGMAGPFGMIRTHDMRDWAQRQPACHDYFAHRGGIIRDGFWQLMCDVKLDRPPELQLEPRIATDRFLHFFERTWMLQQLPVALLMYLLGGWAYIFWAVCLRVAVSVTGHWFVGHFAHNTGHKSFHVDGASVQGYNVRPFRSKLASHLLSIASFGESLHNNHHAYPGSARLSQKSDEIDVGWGVLKLMEKVGLAWNLRVSSDLPTRPELRTVPQ